MRPTEFRFCVNRKFLIYRVELKVYVVFADTKMEIPFLIYRVELKVMLMMLFWIGFSVPNLPCGVESYTDWIYGKYTHAVPNLPCGVERRS